MLVITDKVILILAKNCPSVQIYDRVTWEYGSGGNFSCIVCRAGLIQAKFYSTVIIPRINSTSHILDGVGTACKIGIP
jgi:hypothetical protein